MALLDGLCTEAHLQDSITVSNCSDVSSDIQDTPPTQKEHYSIGIVHKEPDVLKTIGWKNKIGQIVST